MRLRKRMLMVVGLLAMTTFAGAVAAEQQAASTDREGQAILQLLGKGEEAGGWCTWTCSNGQSGSGPAPNADACQQMCEISCGEPCTINAQ